MGFRWHHTHNNQLEEMKNSIVAAVLGISVLVFAATVIINLMNHRPWENVVFPLVASVIMGGIYRLYRQNRYRRSIKTFFLAFLCFLYLPVAWLTSPGSYSAMSFYGMTILFISIIVASEWWEYLFPLGTALITVLLLVYEPTRPHQYTLYADPSLRAIDLSINYLIAAATFFVVIMVMNRSFTSEHQRIFDASITDTLTGLYNRRYLYHLLGTLTSENVAPHSAFTLLMMDLNHFKKINDTFGHSEGDVVLKAFGEVLRQASRKSDIAIRYGGDEFILLLMGTADTDAAQVEERVAQLFQPICDQYPAIGLSVSFGRAGSEAGTADEIIKLADDLLYQHKSSRS
ncbi:GGDEF domain-containing protein [Anoxynatronum sibiricum]|uniref:GGDEF domain-containing protein n=1 Tax=Anoxynatronum sibiricum TaxID=210623 RepID=A0ABU9VX74_9CLOT